MASSSTATKRFQLRASAVFLTFPQCDVPKETALDRLKVKFDTDLKFAVVAHELHQSGDNHLHCTVAFTKQKSFSGQGCFDFVGGKHGDYKPVRGSLAKTVAYTIKSGDYVEYQCNAKELSKGKKKVLQAMCDEVKSGVDFVHLWDTYGAPAMIQRRNLEYVINLELKRKEEHRLLSWSPTARAINSELPAAQIADWLNRFIKRTDLECRKDGFRQLYISGPPAIGKTTLVNQLSRYLRIYTIPNDEEWYDRYEDQAYDLAVLDEFTGNKPIHWMNQWMGGQRMEVKRKLLPAIQKRQVLPTLVLSNLTLTQVYKGYAEKHPGESPLTALQTRFFEISLTRPFTITFPADDTPVESIRPEVLPIPPASTTTDMFPGEATTSPAASTSTPSLAVHVSSNPNRLFQHSNLWEGDYNVNYTT